MIKTQQFELMALIAIVLLSKSVVVQSSAPAIDAATSVEVSAEDAVGGRKAMIELSDAGYTYQGVLYPKEDVSKLLSALKNKGITHIGIHSSSEIISLLSELNKVAYQQGLDLSA